MEDILDSIANITTLLEDAISEQDWELVDDVKGELDGLYTELDKNSYKLDQEY